MSQVRSKRLAGPVQPLTAGGTIYTVPDGRTALMKSLRAVNVSAGAALLDVCVNVLDEGHALIWQAELAPRPFVFADTIWTVLQAADLLIVRASVAAALTVTVSGAELGGP